MAVGGGPTNISQFSSLLRTGCDSAVDAADGGGGGPVIPYADICWHLNRASNGIINLPPVDGLLQQ